MMVDEAAVTVDKADRKVRLPALTLRAMLLAERMRDLREESGLSHQSAAELLGLDVATLNRCELGVLPFRRDWVAYALDLYGETDGRARRQLTALAAQVWVLHQWELVEAPMAAPVYGLIGREWIEARAVQIRVYGGAVLVPELVQVERYASAVAVQRHRTGLRDKLGQAAAQRRDRIEALTSRAVPLTVVVDEQALHRPVGGVPEVMRDQLRYLSTVGGTRPGVEVRILPVEVGLHTGLDGGFCMYQMPALVPVVCVDHFGGRLTLELGPAYDYAAAFDGLLEETLSASDSLELIDRIAGTL